MLNPKQFLYHGTNAPLKAGDVVSPQPTGTIKEAISRGSTSWKLAKVDHTVPMAFATSDLDEARHYAAQTATPDVLRRRKSTSRTPRIYQVEPIDHKSVINYPGSEKGGVSEVASPKGFRVVKMVEKGTPAPARTRQQKNELQKKRRRPHSVPPVTGLPKKPSAPVEYESIESIIKGK